MKRDEKHMSCPYPPLDGQAVEHATKNPYTRALAYTQDLLYKIMLYYRISSVVLRQRHFAVWNQRALLRTTVLKRADFVLLF